MQSLTKVIRRNMSQINRFVVPPEKRPWSVDFPLYKPTPWTVNLTGKPWADPDISSKDFNPKFNSIDGLMDRTSHEGVYQVENGYPLNPRGRTGAYLRGKLGRWGPNHAADPIVTTWKRDLSGNRIKDPTTGKYILSFVAIQRRDTSEWAIPGGMVDPGETPIETAKREFLEEALNSLSSTPNNEIRRVLDALFSTGVEVYRGVVDADYRNTDNSWMETVAYNLHDETGQVVDKLPLQAGDDAKHLEWKDISKDLPMFASHSMLIKLVADKHNASW